MLQAKGLVRHAGCSNYSVTELQDALDAAGEGTARYAVVQPRYNLAERADYEGALEDLCVSEGLGVITYYALAAGFLTGKYRSEADLGGKARSRVASQFVNTAGLDLLARMDEVAARHDATPAQVALAWVIARPSVAAPIVSATSVAQLEELLQAARITLREEDFAVLDS
jgi:aryl-alcohol dehydrogenase-like predicted oxidoreductase